MVASFISFGRRLLTGELNCGRLDVREDGKAGECSVGVVMPSGTVATESIDWLNGPRNLQR